MSSFDANTVIAIATSVAALAAIVAAWAAIWQARFTTRVQALLQCISQWDSRAMCATRRKASGALLKGQPDVHVDRVLDFYETIAGLFVKPSNLFRVLPDRWARHTFYWSAVCYWCKSREYIDTVRRSSTECTAWEDLCALMPSWIKAEGGPPTQKDIDDFLADEGSASA